MPRHHDPSDTLTDAGAAGSSAHMLAFACLVGLTLAGFWASLTSLTALVVLEVLAGLADLVGQLLEVLLALLA